MDESKIIKTENTKRNLESIRQQMNDFMMQAFLRWHGENKPNQDLSMNPVSTANLNYQILAKDADPSKFGEYTVNIDTIELNYGERQPKIKVIDLREFSGQAIAEAISRTIERYGSHYNFPGIEYVKFLMENPDKVPEEVKTINHYYLAGSLIRDEDGNWYIPLVGWVRRDNEITFNSVLLNEIVQSTGVSQNIILLER